MTRKRGNPSELADSKAEPPPDKEAKEKSCTVPSSSGSTRASAGSSKTCSSRSSTRGFQNYVDTPSRMRSLSKPKSRDHQCFCASARKLPACACSRELEGLYAAALERWVSSSRRHICQEVQPKSTSVQLCVGKSSEQASTESSSPKKSVTKRRARTIPIRKSSDSKQIKAESPVRTALAVSKRGSSPSEKLKIVNPEVLVSPVTDPRLYTPKMTASEKLRRDFYLRTMESERRDEKNEAAKAAASIRAEEKQKGKKKSRSRSTQTISNLCTARAGSLTKTAKSPRKKRTAALPRSRSPRGSLAPVSPRCRGHYLGSSAAWMADRRRGSETPPMRTARPHSPGEKSDHLTFDATFRVKDQETDELHTLVLNAEMQGRTIKKLILNGRACMVK
ncbi:hypothetical protein ANCCAN_07416 [Ancylostoma caninum]|uniref:Uncharacterized protein n=1 Tax=Ancylostoma caninum TaxID=29170 RepID=A0A368GQB3_ANCCA|nr:hypothetical protein ANCCAN_07416 [Ancylostoma caninum]